MSDQKSIDNSETIDILQRELTHWKEVAEELEQRVKDLNQNEADLIKIAEGWEKIAKRHKANSELWEHTAIKKEQRIEELIAEIEKLEQRPPSH
jgi:predicted  nucleic acid-binding Zn-ribbon protein